MRRLMTVLTLGLATVLLIPATAPAAARSTGLTYTTMTYVFGVQATATVAGLRFEPPNEFGEICVAFDLTVHGTFQYWTGSELVTMTQDPVPQTVRNNCRNTVVLRQDLVDFYLNTEAGTFDLTRLTATAGPVYFRGSDGSVYIGYAPLGPLVLTATTHRQHMAICRLRAKVDQLSDIRLVIELNHLLSLFPAE